MAVETTVLGVLGEQSTGCVTENAVAKEIADVAYRIHPVPGPGLFESVEEAVLASEL
jgi:hypothetical protein